MMVMTSVNERPVTDPAGTIGAVVGMVSERRERPARSAAPVSSFGDGPGRGRAPASVEGPVVGPP